MGLNNREFMNDETARLVYQTFTEVYRTGKPTRAVVWELVRKDKNIRFIEASVSLMSDPTGEPIGFRGVARDITERVRSQEERAQMEEQLRQQERLAAIGQLAGGIAHDFNNLLTSIILYAQIIKNDALLPLNLASSAENILHESRRAAELVQQILDFSRRAMIETRPVDLTPFIERITGTLRRTLPENIRLTVEGGTGPFVVKADPTRIQQVVMNLATNARDAMPEGGELRIGLSPVRVRAGERPPVAEMDAGEWVCLAVSDTGTGMTEEVQAHLFEPFFTTKEVGKGTGLGLAQVHGIVKQHGGCIGVETALGPNEGVGSNEDVGGGTTFRVYLPAYKEGVEGIAEEPLAMPVGKGETILLVEDDDSIRDAGQSVLESLGYRVLTAADGREALEAYRSAKGVDLVITDVMMPEMGGRQLFRELRGMTPGIKVLAITGYGMQEDLATLEKDGFLDVVHKPFDVDALAQAVHQALDVEQS
jgi:signal transduction histidine kinase/ActR/RegA family two-component response regulator